MHTETAMTDGYKWWASADDEYYTVGPCDTREEAIELAKEEELGAYQNSLRDWRLGFYVQEASQTPIDLSKHLDTENALERLMESADEEHGGEDSYPTENAWTEEQHKDLQQVLTQAVADWQARHGIVVKPWAFTETRNNERVDLPITSP